MTIVFAAEKTRNLIRRIALCLTLSALATPAFAETSDYTVEVGDVLSFDVVGILGVKRNSAVASDGNIVIPIGGRVKAAGRTLQEIRDEIVKRLGATSYPGARDAQGKETWFAIYPEEVIIDIAEYRPVYLTGDVAVQGRQLFVPGMTVLQSISAAGGFESVLADVQNPAFMIADIGSETRDLWSQLSAAEARMLRLQAESDGLDAVDFRPMSPTPLSDDLIAGFRGLEAEQLKTRTADHDAAKISIRSAIDQADKRIALLAEKTKSEEAALKADEQEADRVKSLFTKGLTRMSDSNTARRDLLNSSIQMLQTASELSLIQRERIVLERSLEKLDSDRRLDLVTQMQVTAAVISDVDAKLRATREKMRYLGAEGLTATTGGRPTKIYTIVRRTEEGVVKLSASEDTGLVPGDVIEVALELPAAPDHEPSLMLSSKFRAPVTEPKPEPETAKADPVLEPAPAGLDLLPPIRGKIPAPHNRPTDMAGKLAADIGN